MDVTIIFQPQYNMARVWLIYSIVSAALSFFLAHNLTNHWSSGEFIGFLIASTWAVVGLYSAHTLLPIRYWWHYFGFGTMVNLYRYDDKDPVDWLKSNTNTKDWLVRNIKGKRYFVFRRKEDAALFKVTFGP